MRASFTLVPLMLCAAAAASQPVAAPVQSIALYSYDYNPDPIVLTAGKAVTLHFVNRSGGGHDFTAKRFFGAARIISGNVTDGEVELSGGRSASVTLVPAKGRYKVHCGRTFHKMLGMTGDIVVR